MDAKFFVANGLCFHAGFQSLSAVSSPWHTLMSVTIPLHSYRAPSASWQNFCALTYPTTVCEYVQCSFLKPGRVTNLHRVILCYTLGGLHALPAVMSSKVIKFFSGLHSWVPCEYLCVGSLCSCVLKLRNTVYGIPHNALDGTVWNRRHEVLRFALNRTVFPCLFIQEVLFIWVIIVSNAVLILVLWSVTVSEGLSILFDVYVSSGLLSFLLSFQFLPQSLTSLQLDQLNMTENELPTPQEICRRGWPLKDRWLAVPSLMELAAVAVLRNRYEGFFWLAC